MIKIERVNYDAMGWERIKSNDGRLFAVRTVLWGFPSGVNAPPDAWPILDVGEHKFPFVCQMPVINYPPTFQHHLIANAFNLIVSVERPGSLSIISKPYPVLFQPIIETMPIKNIHPCVEETRLTSHIKAQLTVPRLAFHLPNERLIPVQVQFLSDMGLDENSLSLSQLRVYVKRYYNISYKTFSRSEATIIAQNDYPKLIQSCPTTVSLTLTLPANKSEIPVSLNYSSHLSVEYKLCISVKIRHGPIHVKKKLFELPLLLGTLPVGTRGPRQLEVYSYDTESTSMHDKPTFLKPETRQGEGEECLPAYSDEVPPKYLPRNTSVRA